MRVAYPRYTVLLSEHASFDPITPHLVEAVVATAVFIGHVNLGTRMEPVGSFIYIRSRPYISVFIVQCCCSCCLQRGRLFLDMGSMKA